MSLIPIIGSIAGSGGSPAGDPHINIVFEGDSITENNQLGGPADPTSWTPMVAAAIQSALGIPVNHRNIATGGAIWDTQLVNRRNPDVINHRDPTATHDIVVVWCGTNDLATYGFDAGDVTFIRGQAANYITLCNLAGFKVFLLTVLPRIWPSDQASYEAARASLNAGYATDAAGIATIIDTASTPDMDDPSDTTYYLDTVHPTAAGNILIADFVADAIIAELTP